MLTESLKNAIESALAEKTGKTVSVEQLRPLSGGSINDAYKLETTAGDFFMKHNRKDRYPEMFEKEAQGLQLLLEAKEIRVPEVIATGDDIEMSFILLEYIDSTHKQTGFWEDFGCNLAALHQHQGNEFGLDHDNYIGSLEQINDPYEKWTDFFRLQRLGVQIEMAEAHGLMPASTQQAFERMFKRLDEIFPEEPPSLIHGDLWSGNYMVDDSGKACIIDPAVYYGFREMDIGMSRLFGVFGSGFYDAYNETYPMAPGWRERVEICNLYPLMVHVNLFGAGYLGSVNSILQRF